MNSSKTPDCRANGERWDERPGGSPGTAERIERLDMPVAALARPLVAVREDMPVDELTLLLLERKLSFVPVVGPRDEVVGCVSMTDIVREHVMEGSTGLAVDDKARRRADSSLPLPPESGFSLVDSHPRRVREIMMPFVLTLDERATIAQTAAVLAARGVQQLVLVSSTGEAKGTVDARDVLRACARREGVYVADDVGESWRKECESAI